MKMEANIWLTFVKHGHDVDQVKACNVWVYGSVFNGLAKGKVIIDCRQATCTSIQLKVTFSVFHL